MSIFKSYFYNKLIYSIPYDEENNLCIACFDACLFL